MKRLPTTAKTSPPAPKAARARIVAAARREFFANGFRHVTMDDLAAELGMSKKTFYTHFPGKTELLRAVLMEKFDEVDADMARVTGGGAADVPVMLQQLLACGQRHKDEIQPAFLRDIQREAPEMFQLVEVRRGECLRRHWGRLFRDGRKAGLFRKDIPATLMIEILLGAVQSIVNPPKLAELGLTPRTAVPGIIDVILRGVTTEKGKSLL